MMDFIDELANNDIFLTSLVGVLILLVIIFFIILFWGGKKSKKKSNEVVNNIDDQIMGDNPSVDFNHEEYVKEATAEFELAPASEVKATTQDVEVNNIEETPAYKYDGAASVETTQMNNFSFDELSRMISEELNNLDKQEEFTKEIPTFEQPPVVEKVEVKEEMPKEIKEEANIPQVTFVDSFKEVKPEPIPVEVSKPIEPVVFEKEALSSLDQVLINKTVNETNENEIKLPKLASEEKSEPVIKENNVPLYARFNQESYDIKEKD